MVDSVTAPMTKAEIRSSLVDLDAKINEIKKMTHYEKNLTELDEVNEKLKDKALWDDPDRAKLLGQRGARLEESVKFINNFSASISDSTELFEILNGEGGDDESLRDLEQDIRSLYKDLENVERETMFSHDYDNANAFVEIQAGQGGTEAQDWAEMLLRMYLKWSDSHKFNSDVLEIAAGDVAGIKGASIQVKGNRAYGWLRTETGIHRLVRKSPFNAGNKRHTSFASVFVTPEVDSSIELEINPKDLRIDTYRASGAGGQHVNKTDSAVRITHIPTGVVAQCQNQRSQHQNKDKAMKQLRSKLYLLEEEKRNQERMNLEDSKEEISWGRQIRSYVLDDSRIKDLRTGVEKSNCLKVLDGDLDDFIIASLRYYARNNT